MNNIGYIFRQPATDLPPIWKVTPDEPYYIRRFDVGLQSDLDTVMLMDTHPSVQEMPEATDSDGNDLSYEEMLSSADELDQENGETPSSIFAVTDDKSRVLGWVWYYAGEPGNFPDSLARELNTDGTQTLFLEISYQKLGSDWPEEALKDIPGLEESFVRTERKGVAVSGVRQTLHYLKATAPIKKIIVYAYTELYNKASEKVLEKNGFTCAENLEYDEGCPYHVWFKEL